MHLNRSIQVRKAKRLIKGKNHFSVFITNTFAVNIHKLYQTCAEGKHQLSRRGKEQGTALRKHTNKDHFIFNYCLDHWDR